VALVEALRRGPHGVVTWWTRGVAWTTAVVATAGVTTAVGVVSGRMVLRVGAWQVTGVDYLRWCAEEVAQLGGDPTRVTPWDLLNREPTILAEATRPVPPVPPQAPPPTVWDWMVAHPVLTVTAVVTIVVVTTAVWWWWPRGGGGGGGGSREQLPLTPPPTLNTLVNQASTQHIVTLADVVESLNYEYLDSDQKRLLKTLTQTSTTPTLNVPFSPRATLAHLTTYQSRFAGSSVLLKSLSENNPPPEKVHEHALIVNFVTAYHRHHCRAEKSVCETVANLEETSSEVRTLLTGYLNRKEDPVRWAIATEQVLPFLASCPHRMAVTLAQFVPPEYGVSLMRELAVADDPDAPRNDVLERTHATVTSAEYRSLSHELCLLRVCKDVQFREKLKFDVLTALRQRPGTENCGIAWGNLWINHQLEKPVLCSSLNKLIDNGRKVSGTVESNQLRLREEQREARIFYGLATGDVEDKKQNMLQHLNAVLGDEAVEEVETLFSTTFIRDIFME